MNALPCAAKRSYVLLKLPLNASHIGSGEAVVFSERDRTVRAVEFKDGFMTTPNHMHVRGAMVIVINSNSQPAKPQNGWHEINYSVKPNRLGFYLGADLMLECPVLVVGVLNLRAADSHIRGVLGEDFLEHFDMLVDFAHRLLCLDDSASMRADVKGPHIALVAPAQADSVPLPNLLIIAAHLSGETRPIRLMLDSGANIPYLYNTSQRLPVHTSLLVGASMLGSGADGDQHLFSALPPQAVKMGALELPGVTFFTFAHVQDSSRTRAFDGLLTMDLFRRVFISHADHFVVLEPR